MSLWQNFELNNYHYIYIIGAGGKTTLMYSLAKDIASKNCKVITSCSTKIYYPKVTESPLVLIEPQINKLQTLITEKQKKYKHLTIVKSNLPSQKLQGFSPGELDLIYQYNQDSYLIVEADGSAGKSLKAHHDYEPVISEQAELFIVVIGSDCLGKNLCEENVHRAKIFADLLNKPFNTAITPADISQIIFHPHGYLKKIPKLAPVMIAITKVSKNQTQQALKLSRVIKNFDKKRKINKVIFSYL